VKSSHTSQIEQSLEVGLQAIFYPESQRTGNQRLEAVIRGWQAGHYILVEVRLDHERTLLFHAGAECSLRFIKDGVAYAVESNLQSWQVSRREPQARIAWPRALRSAAIRRHERIEVSIPCTIMYEGKEIEGTLQDLSVGGCGVTADSGITPGSQPSLRCVLPDGVRLEGLPVLARTAKPKNDGQSYIGFSFPRSEHPGLVDIAFYVGTSVLRMRQHAGQSPRYLVLGRDDDDISILRDALDPSQCHVVTAGCLLDALVHSRLVVPAFILLAFDWGEATALDACRILRASPAHRAVPIFVYGRPQEEDAAVGDEASLREQVLNAGATDYYPDLPDFETITALLGTYSAASA
jgi:CheY-like chemotaxis protein